MARDVSTLAAALAALACMTAANTAGAQSSAPAQGSSPEKTLQEVTVTAAKLKERISRFVDQIAALAHEEGLPRWNVPICPQERGLPRPEGVWVLARLVAIAHAAGAPMAHAHCRPNLYIVASSDPELLLRRTRANNRNRIAMFGDATPYVIDEFIETPHPVRVWYGSRAGGALGKVLGSAKAGGTQAGDRPTTWFYNGASRLRSNVIWSFSVVVEIADQRQLRGSTLGQFADYAAMVALAEIKPGAHLGDAPSILKLFDGSPKTAPAGMTDWDRAFLKSLYLTDQASTLQRGQIGREMVRELIH
ncbi:MAG: hypothetical protein ACREUT_07815 [Steroidobacteraceae bacterium]